MYFAIRVAVMSGIGIAYYLTRGFGSPIEDTFAMSLLAVSTSHAVVVGLRLTRSETPKPALAQLGATVVIAAGALAFLLVHGPHKRTGPLAYRTVDELMRDPVIGDEIKLHGYVELGSMASRIDHEQVTFRFTLAQNKQRIVVEYAGVAPDTLKDRAEVVATGRLSRADLFVATGVIAKCPSTYQTANGPVPASRYR
jgi:cytochrome c-type biogenesis protein CcmE